MLSGVTPAGEPVHIDDGVAPRLVAFLTSSCLPCRLWWAELGTRAHPAAVIVTPDPSTEDARAVAALDTGRVPVVMSSDAWFAYGIRGSPILVVERDRTVAAKGDAHSWAELEAILRRAGIPLPA